MTNEDLAQKSAPVDKLLRACLRKYHQDYSSQNEEAKIAGLMAPLNSDKLQALFIELLGYEPETVLDVGCGTGRFLRGLPVSWRKHGLEYRPKVVEIAKLLVDEKTQIHQGAAAELPFDSNRFDVVTSFQVLEHINDPELAINEMFRVTKPGGLVYGELPNKWYPREGHIGLIYPQLLPIWLRKPYIDHFAKTNKTSEEFDYLRNINYLTPSQVLGMLRKHTTRVIHLTPARLERRYQIIKFSPLAKFLGRLGANFAGIEFVAIK